MLKKISNIHKLCFPSAPWSENDFLELKNSGCEIIASENGFIVWRNVADETEIITIGVAPASRGTGIADAMLTLMEKSIMKSSALSSPPVEGEFRPSVGKELRTLHKIFLEVSDKNQNAIKLYERSGYEKIATRKNYYSDGSDAIVMQKVL